MRFRIALDNLCRNYPILSRKAYRDLLVSGVNKGFSVLGAYNGIKIVLASETGQREYFTLSDVCEITGESLESVNARVEEMIRNGEMPKESIITAENIKTMLWTI